jgi:hypothetical protein
MGRKEVPAAVAIFMALAAIGLIGKVPLAQAAELSESQGMSAPPKAKPPKYYPKNGTWPPAYEYYRNYRSYWEYGYYQLYGTFGPVGYWGYYRPYAHDPWSWWKLP